MKMSEIACFYEIGTGRFGDEKLMLLSSDNSFYKVTEHEINVNRFWDQIVHN